MWVGRASSMIRGGRAASGPIWRKSAKFKRRPRRSSALHVSAKSDVGWTQPDRAGLGEQCGTIHASPAGAQRALLFSGGFLPAPPEKSRRKKDHSTLIPIGSHTPKLASAWLGVGAALCRDLMASASPSRGKPAPTVSANAPELAPGMFTPRLWPRTRPSGRMGSGRGAMFRRPPLVARVAFRRPPFRGGERLLPRPRRSTPRDRQLPARTRHHPRELQCKHPRSKLRGIG